MPFQNELLYETNCLYSKVFCYVSVSKVQPKCTVLWRQMRSLSRVGEGRLSNRRFQNMKDALHAITYSTINLSRYRS